MTKLLPVESYYFTSFKEKNCEIHSVWCFFFTENSMQQEHILLAREFPPKIICVIHTIELNFEESVN